MPSAGNMGVGMSRTLNLAASAALLLIVGCKQGEAPSGQAVAPPAAYFDNAGHPDAWSGGAQKITISTPKGPHQVWIKRVGNNPKLKLLLLTGGPGLSHAYLEVMDSYLPAEGVEYYHYDQLETGESDRPNDPFGTPMGDMWGEAPLFRELQRIGYRPTWYHIPEAEGQIQVALSVAGGMNWAVYLLPLSGLFMSVVYPTLNSKGISCLPKAEHGAAAGVILFFTCVSAVLAPLAIGAVADAAP